MYLGCPPPLPTVANSDELPPLLLFIPGTGLAPQDYTLFPRHAATSLRLPSIGLAYPSNMAATSACMAAPDQHCYEGYHESLLEYQAAPCNAITAVGNVTGIDRAASAASNNY